MRLARALVWIAPVALSGCGSLPSDPCAKADQAVQAIAEKTRSCSGLPPFTVQGKSKCESAVKSCTEADKTIIREEMDCVINLSACVNGKESDFATAAGLCVAATSQLTAACKQGLGL